MINAIKIICYVFVAYGACNVIVFGEGPFHIFDKMKAIAGEISDGALKMLTCMMCLPANFGWICSLFNWFLIDVPFTPFNIIFYGHSNLWWLASLCDGAFTTATVFLIYVLDDYFEKKTEKLESNDDNENLMFD